MEQEECLFCRKEIFKDQIIAEDGLFYSKWDANPVTKGHALIIPRKHIDSFFDLTEKEVIQFLNLIKKTKEVIENKHKPDGYNLGINEGELAGRTVHHLHLHLIPRYKGDVKNPRGGIRHVIPGKGFY